MERETAREGGRRDEGMNLHARDHVLVQGLISNGMDMWRYMHINPYPARDVSL